VSIAVRQVLEGYASGIFPMARADGAIEWWRPDPRGIIPLDEFHVPSSLARVVRSGRFALATDVAFEEVMRACADRPETWISEDIIRCYTELHRMGVAHSVECRGADGTLVGGLYGVALGGAFFGESMFSRAANASKVALVHLVDRMRRGNFVLLDVQFQTDHLERFGAVEIRHDEYMKRLEVALRVPARWHAADAHPDGGGPRPAGG
jgi:leucyl/phenylalanyl-tRNA--protein transferase